jgi:uncharacterized protein (DUF302 family)
LESKINMNNKISFAIKLNKDYEVAKETVTEALITEGFGVLTEVNVKETLKTKIDADFRRYSILGVCNPHLAHKALSSDPLVGMMLPCNVTVEETEDGGSLINIINPMPMMTSNPDFNDNIQIQEVGKEATRKLKKVADLLAK